MWMERKTREDKISFIVHEECIDFYSFFSLPILILKLRALIFPRFKSVQLTLCATHYDHFYVK